MRSGGGFAKIREGKVGARRAVPLLYWFAGFPLRCNSKNYEWNRWNTPTLPDNTVQLALIIRDARAHVGR